MNFKWSYDKDNSYYIKDAFDKEDYDFSLPEDINDKEIRRIIKMGPSILTTIYITYLNIKYKYD